MTHKIKKRFAALAAALFVAILGGPLTFAVNWDTSFSPGEIDSTDPEATNYVVFAQTSGTENQIGSTILTGGVILVAVGGVGILSLIVWQIVSRRRDRDEEEREDIFDEIQQAEALSRKRRAAEEQARAYEQRVEQYEEEDEYAPYDKPEPQPELPKKRYDPYAVTGEIPLVPDRADYTVERPIVPTTPPSMQPKAPRRVQQPPVQQPRHAKPDTADTPPTKPVQPAVPAARPAQPAPARKFDLDDILREVREENAKRS